MAKKEQKSPKFQTSLSKGMTARQLVYDKLNKIKGIERVVPALGVRIAIMALHEEVSALRSDHALAVQALLSAAGKVDEKDAEKWVEESFKRK